MTWRINGVSLGDGDTAVLLEHDSPRGSVQWNHAAYPQRDANPLHQRTTTGPGAYSFRFRVVGEQGGIGYWTNQILALFDEPVITLESVTGVKLHRDAARVALRAVNAAHVVAQGLNTAIIEVRCILEGVWTADGGDYCQTLFGYYTQTATGFEDEDGAEAASGLPELTVPEQMAGSPVARKPDGTTAVPTLLRQEIETTSGGEQRRVDVYDLTGFLTPTPSAEGDVAVWELVSCPTDAALDWIITMGIASQSIGSFAVATS